MKQTQQRCVDRGHHEYAMVYNVGTTCLDCGYHRSLGEEIEFIRSESGVEVPLLLCDLARALPMPQCPPGHTLREHPDYCKDCDESRDELQQMVGDGDLNAIAIVVGVYLRRLYAEHDQMTEALRACFSTPTQSNEVEVWERSYTLENIFAEVLSDKDRGIPSDEAAIQMIEEMAGAQREQIVDVINRRRIK